MSEIKEYYKSILSNYLENISKEEVVEKKYDIPSFILTAKQARIMTDKAIIHKLHSELEKVKEYAKEGKCKRPLRINKKFDYKFVVEYLTNALGYILTDFTETEDSIEFTLNW